MVKVAEVTERLDSINTTVQKISAESTTTLQAVADLRAQIEILQQSGTDVPAELISALERVEASVKTVDDLVPDPEPQPETPVTT